MHIFSVLLNAMKGINGIQTAQNTAKKIKEHLIG